MERQRISALLFVLLALVSVLPMVSPAVALFSGLVFAFCFGNPFPAFTRKGSKYLLQVAVVLLGFGQNLHTALEAGRTGVQMTLFTVVLVMVLGFMMGRWFRISTRTAYLISAGTAICGGSAIAAVSPVVRANEVEISVSLVIVFMLNAIALLLFPFLGHSLHLTQHQFGMWAAIAIHDTSSVVGAGATYGAEALQTATTVKLTRALWIIPLAFASTFVFRNKTKKITVPWFILWFVVAMAAATYLPIPETVKSGITFGAKRMLSLTLFLIGSGLTRPAIRSVGLRPLIMGIGLWIVIGVVGLMVVMFTC
ncbi:YeiH family protein [Parabacteroides sp. FAFU027]|uniref:YeiH family protein n=1 Tax=Parabacteroides sp. FAFU027 TaxID=2922715 RepID=UPI001FAECC14|nr:putative sulfate exporter family transporter [Parabacteroides sp. FAFU027]